MGDRGADEQEQHACSTAQYDSPAAVATESQRERYGTQRYYNDQDLCVQVPGRELRQEWQAGDDQRQCKTVHEAQRRQRYRGAIEPVRRFR